jgi:putative zinc finger protein
MDERGRMPPCQEATELLPWLLNGTLEAGEAERVRAHVESCAACRHELGETRWAAAVFGAHLPAQTLVALAWDRPGDFELARRHLESCPACAEELALVRESRRLESEEERRPAGRPAPVALRYGSLAAALLVGFGAGIVSLRVIGGGPAGEREQLAGRVGELEGQVRALRESESGLKDAVRRLEAPELNLPIVEVLPDSAVPRSASGPETRVVVPNGARLVALVLGSDRAGGAADADLRDARGTVLWTGTGLQPSRLGGYTLGLPASLLRAGKYKLVLRPARGSAETYSIQVEHAP